MDFIEDYRLVKCLREGLPTDMNVYDAAALSAVVHLSERSNARRSSAVDFPTSRADGGSPPSRSASCGRSLLLAAGGWLFRLTTRYSRIQESCSGCARARVLRRADRVTFAGS